MANVELVSGPVVRIDLTAETKETIDAVWLSLIGEYGTRNVTLADKGQVFEVVLPYDPRVAQVQLIVGALVPMDRHCGA